MRCKQHIIISANGGNTFRLQPLSINSFLNLKFYSSELGLGLVRKVAAGCIIGHAALVFEKNHPLSDQIELKEFDTRQLIMISARGILPLLNKHAPNITTMKLAQWEKTHVLLTSIVKMCRDGAFATVIVISNGSMRRPNIQILSHDKMTEQKMKPRRINHSHTCHQHGSGR